MTNRVPHGSRIGVLGGGQLGQMFTVAAHRLGLRVHIFAAERDSPAGRLADHEEVGRLDDVAAVRAFASNVDALTIETETVPYTSLEAAEEVTLVRPGSAVLRWVQDRSAQREHLQSIGVPVVPFASIRSYEELAPALARLGFPALLKSSRSGYDGRGQAWIRESRDAAEAWRQIGGQPSVLEQFMPFASEFSVVAARSATGEFRAFDPIANIHVRGILDVSSVPARIRRGAASEGVAIVEHVMAASGVIGLLCAEFYLMPDGGVVVNEVCARAHNSGHLTIEASPASQFEQLARAICGLPLGPATFHSPAAMANLIGVDLSGRPAASARGVFIHDYGKVPRPGRKVGHVTVLGPTASDARRLALAARKRLVRSTL